MEEILSATITGIIGLITGTVGFYFANSYLEKKRESLSSKREQLKYVYGPLEINMRTSRQEFERYFEKNTTFDEKVFIEKQIWFPIHSETKRILMEESHYLNEIPEELLKLLEHINVWLSEYDLIYVKEKKNPPVFAGTKGYPYPKEADEYVFKKASELRSALNL